MIFSHLAGDIYYDCNNGFYHPIQFPLPIESYQVDQEYVINPINLACNSSWESPPLISSAQLETTK